MSERRGAELRFRVLGPLEVRGPDGWRAIGAAKWRGILGELLIHAGQVVTAETLAARLWCGEPPPTARTLIRKYVMEVRRAIGDDDAATLLHRSPGYVLRAGDDEIDAGRFERLARDGRAAMDHGDAARACVLCAQALVLWRGPALVDVAGSPSAEAEATRLEELRLQAVETRIEADLTLGSGAGLVAELRRLVSEHHLRESLWRLLMRALWAAGRPAEALAVYAQASELLMERLGAYPGEPLRRLHEAILTERSAPRGLAQRYRLAYSHT
ncbi:AfsR/SARP family transcriptional regulator [Actinoallomurus acaciae]|uniref:BTAD domain-containing putative transcriptional regulator n=1 Tax=Actinoallomurus acaciae TaxID=502577 RepID=A0ABV5YNH9_9ACTN